MTSQVKNQAHVVNFENNTSYYFDNVDMIVYIFLLPNLLKWIYQITRNNFKRKNLATVSTCITYMMYLI